MKKVVIHYGGCETATIEAPDDKDMAFDTGLMQHGVLSIGEYGASGIKICAFKQWDHAWFLDEGGNGYTVTNPNPF